MTRYFCTYFDKNYLLKGLALHASLLTYVGDFKLWILCMDDFTFELLGKMNLQHVKLIQLKDFEDKELLAVKPTRKISEYCWTCTPSLPLYILKHNPNLDMVAYLDADLYFYDSPEKIYGEFGDKSIMIIPHNFSDDQKWREPTSGTYNVGMLIFRNDANALACLTWWREKCLEWCFDTFDNGRLGDQLYLNEWPEKFKSVHILKNPGADIASWNVRKFIFKKQDRKIVGKDRKSGQEFPLIFYHFHATRLYDVFGKIIARHQNTQDILFATIFDIYSHTLTQCLKSVQKIDNSFRYGFTDSTSYVMLLIRSFLQKMKKMILSDRNPNDKHQPKIQNH